MSALLSGRLMLPINALCPWPVGSQSYSVCAPSMGSGLLSSTMTASFTVSRSFSTVYRWTMKDCLLIANKMDCQGTEYSGDGTDWTCGTLMLILPMSVQCSVMFPVCGLVMFMIAARRAIVLVSVG